MGKIQKTGNGGLTAGRGRLLTQQRFHQLAEFPAEAEWLANIANAKTKRAYRFHVAEFAAFVGLKDIREFRQVTRAHVIAYRDWLKTKTPPVSPATVRAKLSALNSLFDDLCDQNAVPTNVVKGVKRPAEGANEGKTPSISDAQAKRLLALPHPDTLKGKRDRAILATFLYHGLRREELAMLKVNDLQSRRGVPYIRVHGKRGKLRHVELHPASIRRASTASSPNTQSWPGSTWRSSRPTPCA